MGISLSLRSQTALSLSLNPSDGGGPPPFEAPLFKIWNGTEWVLEPYLKCWTGTDWLPVKWWNGEAWVLTGAAPIPDEVMLEDFNGTFVDGVPSGWTFGITNTMGVPQTSFDITTAKATDWQAHSDSSFSIYDGRPTMSTTWRFALVKDFDFTNINYIEARFAYWGNSDVTNLVFLAVGTSEETIALSEPSTNPVAMGFSGPAEWTNILLDVSTLTGIQTVTIGGSLYGGEYLGFIDSLKGYLTKPTPENKVLESFDAHWWTDLVQLGWTVYIGGDITISNNTSQAYKPKGCAAITLTSGFDSPNMSMTKSFDVTDYTTIKFYIKRNNPGGPPPSVSCAVSIGGEFITPSITTSYTEVSVDVSELTGMQDLQIAIVGGFTTVTVYVDHIVGIV